MRVISARGPVSASLCTTGSHCPPRLTPPEMVRLGPFGGRARGGGPRPCSVTSAKVTCGAGGEPHSHRSPGTSAQVGLALSSGAAQGRRGPPRLQQSPQKHRHVGRTRTRGILRASLPGTPPSQSASATTGSTPPLKGAGRLPASPRPPARRRPHSASRGQSPSSGRFPGPAPLGRGKLKRGRGRAGEAEEAGLHRNLHLFPARPGEIRGCCGGQSPPARLFPAASAGSVGVVHNHHGGGRGPGW